METTPPETFSVAILLGDRGDNDGANRVEQLELPSPLTPERFAAALIEHNVTAADVRTRLAVVSSDIPTGADAAIIYATLAGLSGRFVPAVLNGQHVNAEPEINEEEAAARPDHVIGELDLTDTDTANTIRYARHVNLPADKTPAETASLLAYVATVRKRGALDRYPHIGDLNLELARKEGAKLRSESRCTALASSAEKTETSPRLKKLQAAADVSIAEILRRLGAKADEETGERWHCPRPYNHTNGDKNPSMKISENKTRCFRCDPEWVDSLRIVMGTLNLTSDEAADWINSGEELPPHTY